MTKDSLISADNFNQYRITTPKPLVTVLINNYNYDRYLEEAIESALAQTWQPLEIIVVDDGSTDNSRQILERYRDKIRIILKENGGQASAFNVGIQAAQGEIICFLDSDDYWVPEKVERVVAKYHEAPWGLVCHDLLEVDAEGARLNNKTYTQNRNVILREGNVLDFLSSVGFIWIFTPTSGMSICSALAKQMIPFPEEEWRISADNPLAYGAVCHAPLGFVKESLAFYRLHGANGYDSINNITKQINNIEAQAKIYFYMKNFKVCQVKNNYYFYRKCCFITRNKVYIYTFKLWKKNFFFFKKLNSNFYLNFFRYILVDTLLVFLVTFDLPNPYKKTRKAYVENKNRISREVTDYLEHD